MKHKQAAGVAKLHVQKLIVTLVLFVAPTIASACPTYACRAGLYYFENGTKVLISTPGTIVPWHSAVIVR